MRTIDGSTGGGQILRSALSLAVLCDEPVRIEHVRGGRENPGLRPQHLAGIALLAGLTDAEVDGDEVGSQTVDFAPQTPPAGTVEIDIGTAGSITLLFDTVLPLGPVVDDPVTVTAGGGTDVKWSPTIDYLDRVRRPVLSAYGFPTDLTVASRGYYPVGRGTATLTVHPAEPVRFDLVEAGHIEAATIFSRASESLRTADVAERQAAGATDELEDADIAVRDTTVTYHDVQSTGTSITVVGHCEAGYAGGDAVGERGVPAEDVGYTAAEALIDAVDTPAAVDRHLADQLLLPLALAGGQVAIPSVTDHVETNLAVLEAFGYEHTVDHRDEAVVVTF